MADPVTPTPAELLSAFHECPQPLALVDRGGTLKVANVAFHRRFDAHPLAPDAMARLVGDGPARSVLVIVEDNESPGQSPDLLETLQARVNELSSLVATDHLTGAWSRAHLDSVLAGELARRATTGAPLSLVLFDIDHFKRVNDTWGHATGDVVLREVVRVARANCRAGDGLFRWGGEEFVLLIPSTGHRRALAIAESLRTAIAAHTFETVGRVTVSLGVAEHVSLESPQAWFERLDGALYEAKRQGRDRSCVAPGGDSDFAAVPGGAGVLALSWQEGYESGHAGIDSEHKELFALANRLIVAATGRDRAATEAALDALIASTAEHFAHEERLLATRGYPQVNEHARVHAGLLRRAKHLRQRVSGEGSSTGSFGPVVEFVALDLVIRHLTSADRAFFEFLHPDSGGAPPPG